MSTIDDNINSFTLGLLSAAGIDGALADASTRVRYEHIWGEFPTLDLVVAVVNPRSSVPVVHRDYHFELRRRGRPLRALRRSLRNRVARAMLEGFDPTWSRLRWALQLADRFEAAAVAVRTGWHIEDSEVPKWS